MKKIIFATLLFFAFFSGCKCKKDKDTAAPFVTIISPTENQLFNVGDSIHVKFDISDDTRIEFAQISVADENQVQVGERRQLGQNYYAVGKNRFRKSESGLFELYVEG